MQLASSLLQYWTTQRNNALSHEHKEQRSAKQKDLSTKDSSSSFQPPQLAQALLWGTGCLSSSISDAFDQLIANTNLLTRIQGGKSSQKRDARIKETSLATANWINQHLPVNSNDPFVTLVAASWIYALRYASASLPSSLWLETLQNILTQVDRAWNDCSDESLLPTLVWGCEIPLVLATQIDQIDGKTKLVQETRQRLKFLISRVDNAEAMWLKHGGCEVRSLLAGVLRCTWLLERLGGKALSKKDYKQLLRYARAGLSLSEVGGQPLLQDGASGHDNDLWQTIVNQWSPDKKLAALVETMTTNHKGSSHAKHAAHFTALPPLGQVFEDSEAAVLRQSWTSNAGLLAVDFSSDPMWLQIFGSHERKLMDGAWDLKIEQDGVEIAIDSPWQQICWLGDDDADYLELQCEAEGICKVQRQIMYIRNEAMVFLCDTLLAERASHWQLTSSWQLADDTQVESFPDNTEVRLVACSAKKTKTIARPAAIALPIGFPEWRASNPAGELSCVDSVLALRHYGVGTRLMSPLVLGIGPKSVKQSYTWRHLTIGDDMKIQPPEQARGYRVQIGSDQVLFYRSLGALRRRTMMSLHLHSEFYAGRFDPRDGEIESLVEVSAEE